MNPSQCVYYDIEVFKNLFLIAAYYPEFDSWTLLLNPKYRDVLDFMRYNENIVGFNNHSYDDRLLNIIVDANLSKLDSNVDTMLAYKISKSIINQEDQKLPRVTNFFKNRTYDCTKYLKSDYAYSNIRSLKAFENSAWLPIIETSVPFDKPCPLDKVDEIVQYCKNDVLATYEYFKVLYDRKVVFDLESLRERVSKVTSTGIDTHFFKGANSLIIYMFQNIYGRGKRNNYNHDSYVNYIKSLEIEDYLGEAIDIYEMAIDRTLPEGFSRDIEGYMFGVGGMHYQNPNEKIAENCWHSDWESLYPHLAILMECLGSATTRYKDIVHERMQAKHSGDSSTAATLKIVVNSIYGLLRSKLSGACIFNAQAGIDICMAGQLISYAICKRIEMLGGIVVQANTDGYVWRAESKEIEDDIKSMLSEMEATTKLSLEHEFFSKIIARDISNYFVIDTSGKVVEQKGLFGTKPNSSLPIVGKMVLDRMIGIEKSLEDYYYENPLDFAYRAKVTGKHRQIGTCTIGFVKAYTKTGRLRKRLQDTVEDFSEFGQHVRGFATKTGKQLRVYNSTTNKYALVPNQPDHIEFDLPPFENIDEDYYISRVTKELEKIIK